MYMLFLHLNLNRFLNRRQKKNCAQNGYYREISILENFTHVVNLF